MIITKLRGGLGNQMFQYAYGRSQSIKNNTELVLNIYNLINANHKEIKRHFELDKFNIIAKIETIKPKINIWQYLFQKINPAFFYYQNEKYFKDIRPQILNEFTLKQEFITENLKKWQEKLSSEVSVSIHIRRGDYVNNPKTNQYHGTCPIEYYKNAIKLIKEKVTNPIFYVSTDDPAWVNENFINNFPEEDLTNISDSNPAGFEQMYLMSQCKHNIIANSSFSWWGAWLNQNPDKIVIAPKSWLKHGDGPHKNIIPKTWTRI